MLQGGPYPFLGTREAHRGKDALASARSAGIGNLGLRILPFFSLVFVFALFSCVRACVLPSVFFCIASLHIFCFFLLYFGSSVRGVDGWGDLGVVGRGLSGVSWLDGVGAR